VTIVTKQAKVRSQYTCDHPLPWNCVNLL